MFGAASAVCRIRIGPREQNVVACHEGRRLPLHKEEGGERAVVALPENHSSGPMLAIQRRMVAWASGSWAETRASSSNCSTGYITLPGRHRRHGLASRPDQPGGEATSRSCTGTPSATYCMPAYRSITDGATTAFVEVVWTGDLPSLYSHVSTRGATVHGTVLEEIVGSTTTIDSTADARTWCFQDEWHRLATAQIYRSTTKSGISAAGAFRTLII